MIQLKSVPWHDVDEVWHLMESFVLPATEYSNGTLTPETVRAAIADRRMQAMVVVDEEGKIIGTMVTEIHKADTGFPYIHGVTIAGDRFDEWAPQANDLLKQWAKAIGAPFVSLNGRRGWVRKLASLGWKEQSVIVALEVGD